MKKGKLVKTLVFLALLAAAGVILSLRFEGDAGADFIPKRQTEDEILVYQDCSKVELYFHNPADAKAVEIRAEVGMGDGYDEVARAQLHPGETVTILETADGEPFSVFTPAILSGRILVYDLESGRLKERVEPLAFRIYASYKDPYDALTPPNTEREVILDETNYRPPELGMSIDLKKEELRTGLYGLTAEWRNLNSYVYARIDGEEVLLARETIPPRSLVFDLYLEPGAADLFSVGDTISDVRVDSYYADTGEFFDSIPAEIQEVIRSD